MALRTKLYETHKQAGARLVPFGGWDMPLHYGSQLQEHHAVRRDAGVFDVSHMRVVDLDGPEVRNFLRYLLANDVAKLKTSGKALYSCMLNPTGGVVDDLIVYYLNDNWYRMVVNAGTADGDIAWMRQHASGYQVTVDPRPELAMLAVQGPNARDKALPLLPEALRGCAAALKPFVACHGDGWFVGRTGYTGEDGFEIMLPEEQVVALWNGLLAQGVAPCGLGARDTLRLEAGMNLYGSDMDPFTSPLESGLAWTIAWEPAERDFVGRTALQAQRDKPDLKRFVGLVLEGKGVLRNHLPVFDGDEQIGEITSGGFGPTLDRAVALARLARDPGPTCEVEIRGKRVPARLVPPPFARQGRVCIDLE